MAVTAAATSRGQTLGPVPNDHVVVLFGATGDLAKRKLIPGLFHLAVSGLLPERYRIVGTSRKPLVDDEFRALARMAVDEFGRREATDDTWDEFAARLSYAASDAGAADDLADAVHRAEREIGGEPDRLVYLSVPPAAMAGIVRTLGDAGLAEGTRVIMEKPFGTDLASARALNETVHEVFAEEQIFRIDHFLGKEAVQNILALRFANGLFEPVWNRDHIDHVQIDVPETLSIGSRAGFYEGTGALRDMVVTHLFQVLGFVAMEPPVALDAASLLEEKVKVFRATKPLDPTRVVRGQYEGYLDEEGVAPGSTTETFVALEVEIDNWRWAGVPFYLRTGKRLAEGRRVITVAFKEPPLRMFGGDDFAPNELVFEVAEPGGISLDFLAKVPGPMLTLGEARMRFDYADSFCTAAELEAYERLIHDAMLGDHTLFTSSDGIERLWKVVAPVLDSPPPVQAYAAGSWGPETSAELIAPRAWRLPDR
jgi:glucose-6-phosphate 1-dehydrogenase